MEHNSTNTVLSKGSEEKDLKEAINCNLSFINIFKIGDQKGKVGVKGRRRKRIKIQISTKGQKTIDFPILIK